MAAGASAVKVPLRLPTVWPVPGPGPARAVVYGLEGVRPAIELVDLAAGQIVWRAVAACDGPVVGVTAEAIVCTDASATRGIALTGKGGWRSEHPFVAITDDRVVVEEAGTAVVLDAATGDELARVKLPSGVVAETVLASCGDAGRELFAAGQDGRLVRIADAKGGAAISWATPIGAISSVEACEGDAIVASIPGESPGDGRGALVSFARATGKITGRVEGVHGAWPASADPTQLEISTDAGVTRWPRDLGGASTALPLPPLGELIAQRGELRLVRASPLTAVVLDRAGVRAYIPFSEMGAVLGDDQLLAASWSGSQGETVRRLGLPRRYPRVLRLPGPGGRGRGVAVPAELRDLPAPAPLELAAAIAKPDTGKHTVSALALDPVEQ